MAEQTKKPNFFSKIGKKFKELRSEFKKLVWPTPQQLLKNSVVVLVCIVVFGVVLAGLDWLFSQGFVALSNLFALWF